jgi:hypothetical protein
MTGRAGRKTDEPRESGRRRTEMAIRIYKLTSDNGEIVETVETGYEAFEVARDHGKCCLDGECEETGTLLDGVEPHGETFEKFCADMKKEHQAFVKEVRREIAMQAGMAFGCDGYNDVWGY